MSTAPLPSGFQVALQQFSDRLTASEAEQIKITSLSDLKLAIEEIQAEQRPKRALMNMTRILGFIEAMEQFAKVLEVFLNVSDIVAFTWGPVKLLLLVCTGLIASWELGLIEVFVDCQ